MISQANSKRETSMIPINTSNRMGSTNANSTMACAFGLSLFPLRMGWKRFLIKRSYFTNIFWRLFRDPSKDIIGDAVEDVAEVRRGWRITIKTVVGGDGPGIASLGSDIFQQLFG